MRKNHSQQVGQFGEDLALSFLEEKGCRLVTSNYRCRGGEVDLIVWDGETLVFVEVRTLRKQTSERALASVTPRKQQRLLHTAQHFLALEMPECNSPLRFDIVGVRLSESPEFLHLEGAFTL